MEEKEGNQNRIRYKKNKKDLLILLAGENVKGLIQHIIDIEYNPFNNSSQIILDLDKPKKI